MNDSRDFDLNRMMEQIRLKVHDQRRATAAGSDEPGNNRQFQSDLAELHRSYDLSRVSLNPNRRVLGRTMLTASRLVSALLRPIFRRQSEYNAANTRVTTHLQKETDWLRSLFVELRIITERTLESNKKELTAFSEAQGRRLARMYAADFAMHAQALRDLSQRIAAMEQRIQQQERQFQAHYSQISSQVEANYSQVGAQLEARYSELIGQIETVRRAHSEAQSQERSHLEEFKLTRERLMRVERRLRHILSGETVNGAAPSGENPLSPSKAEVEIDYAGFEDRLRNSQTVKDKQRSYVQYFADKAPVIDVGCGKGEFLELMREAGSEAKGLDLDLDMVLQCREKGLDVERCNAIDYLAGRPDDCVGGIFSAQVIEHLTSAQLNALITLSWRKLAPGGIMVLETLNPEALFVHYKWFWMDPSHVRLVHPQTLQFLLESAGFAEVSCLFASPPVDVIPIPPLQTGANGPLDDFNRATDYLNKLIYGDQEYFVVARK